MSHNIRIYNSGNRPNNLTQVTDTETGREIPHIKRVTLDIAADSKPVVAHIEIWGPAVDIVANVGSQTHVCPNCGQNLEKFVNHDSPPPPLS